MAARRARSATADGAAETPRTGTAPDERAPSPEHMTSDISPTASGVSADDEDISDMSQVGRPVIAEVLGGVVIGEIEE